ncbi:hypothetical protein EIP91_007444 [Steccherinum ochraceum]|uniref:Initiator tRNA phosphoribosyl transferase n=1 Tax=Steccherinum ochraceum TaxID=92696 RepID=A0A4R0S0T4_9APHY|nr:hypothetical protein EIP91_007444 [Steccherinum ochraceum]
MAVGFHTNSDVLRQSQTDALALIRKESLDIYNRVHSIAEDVGFVDHVCEAYPELPVVPNLRCGAWYVSPSTASRYAAYFKSTDGHYNNWSFNLRRPNIHLLPALVQHGGLILVDSTRAGKRMPDALSKTVPIWCAVVNRAIKTVFSRGPEWDGKLYTPPGVVSPQEHAHIERRIEEWAESLANSSYTIPDLPYPLRPMWITPATSVFPTLPPLDERGFLAVVCISASKQVAEGVERRSSGYAYVQGSGDDHELWGMGLTPQIFWEEKDNILDTTRSDLPDLVSELVSSYKARRQDDWRAHCTPLSMTSGRLLVTSTAHLPYVPPATYDLKSLAHVIITDNIEEWQIPKERMDEVSVVEMKQGKKGQAQFLHEVLPRSLSFIRTQLERERDVCVSCADGRDASVGVVLAALQTFFDEDGRYVGEDVKPRSVNKSTLATRLQWIISDRPEANPSRVTLKRVNEFLLTSPDLRR